MPFDENIFFLGGGKNRAQRLKPASLGIVPFQRTSRPTQIIHPSCRVASIGASFLSLLLLAMALALESNQGTGREMGSGRCPPVL